MKKSSKKIRIEAKEALAKAEELAKQIEIEEKEILEQANKNIQSVCEENNLFCGVIITKEDLLKIISVAMDTKDNIKIPFNLYLNEINN